MNHFRTIWDALRTSLWLVPSAMVVGAVVLAVVMLQVDAGEGTEDHVRAWWINQGDGEDARNLLSTLVTAIITMASMAFSVTVVALTLAANVFGSRLIRNFRADLRTQLALGMFAMTIVYCLLVLRSVHGKAAMPDVPHAAVTVGTLLALISVLALLAFIQGVARLMVADEVTRRVRDDIDSTIEEFPPLDAGGAPEHGPADLPRDFESGALRVPLSREGYVQAIDYQGLVEWARCRDAFVRLDLRPGDFAVEGDRPILVYPTPADPAAAGREINRLLVIGVERTPTQDLEFAIRHLVEVALRALSPGINDPYTAIAVLDRLRGCLSRLMGRRLPAETVRDGAGRVRLWRRATSHAGIIDAAFHQIRQAAPDKPAVLMHMLETIARMAEHTRLDEQRAALARHAGLIRAAGERGVQEPADRDDLLRRFERAVEALQGAFPEERSPPLKT